MLSSKLPYNLYRSPDGFEMVSAFYDETLKRMGHACTSRFVETSFGRTHLLETGKTDSNPVVLWHGQNANATSWVKWIQALAPDWRIIAIDTIGGMGKSAGVRLRTKGADFGRWAAEVLRGLQLATANLIGISYGGWLIMKLAQVAPDLIGSAVLLSSAGFLSIRPSLIVKMVRQSLGADHRQIVENLAAMIYAPGQLPDPYYVELLEFVLKSGYKPEPFAPKLSGREISNLTAPTQVLMGQYENSFDPHRALKRAKRYLPNLKSAELIPDVGHSLDHADPLLGVSWVKDFLDRYAAA